MALDTNEPINGMTRFVHMQPDILITAVLTREIERLRLENKKLKVVIATELDVLERGQHGH